MKFYVSIFNVITNVVKKTLKSNYLKKTRRLGELLAVNLKEIDSTLSPNNMLPILMPILESWKLGIYPISDILKILTWELYVYPDEMKKYVESNKLLMDTLYLICQSKEDSYAISGSNLIYLLMQKLGSSCEICSPSKFYQNYWNYLMSFA